jgi:TPP-dependent pyruvate/acetoin dehydrogenase alpha subunit
MTITKELQLEMLRRMERIHEFETTAVDLFKRGQVKGAIHTCFGMEASHTGICLALRKDDLIAGTHRSHGHNLAKGADPKFMFAEILGRETGYCRGRGGSMHIAAFDTGSLGALAVVGAGMPIAVGAALGFKMRGEDRVAVPFFGDGASNCGNFHESMNLASIWNLPVVFALENNRYAVSTNISYSCRIEDLSIRAQSYGMRAMRVDGFDPIAVYQAATEAVALARSGQGPTLLVTECYRLDGHYSGEPQVYRTRDEVETWRAHEPVTRFRGYLLANGVATQAELDAIHDETVHQMEEGLAFARASRQPDPSTAIDYIYAD